jgi:citrate lyase alpha subunit
VHTIDALATQAAAQAHPARSRKPEGRIVAVSEYRDGSVTDVIRAP